MIERLLVPMDGGSLDARAFSGSIALARQLGAAIVGVLVEPFRSARSLHGDVPGDPAPLGDAALQAHASRLLARFEQDARDAGVPFRGVATQSSDIGGAIVATALEQRCDMIVMATHSRGAIAQMLQGSHTRDVLSRTTLPVLVLH